MCVSSPFENVTNLGIRLSVKRNEMKKWKDYSLKRGAFLANESRWNEQTMEQKEKYKDTEIRWEMLEKRKKRMEMKLTNEIPEC